MNEDWRDAVERVRNGRLDTAERVEAAAALGAWADAEAVQAFVGLAEDASLPDEVARAVGRSLALVAWRLGDLNAVPLADLTGEAYLGFDEQAAELLRERDSGTDDNERRTEEP
jgi:HEAT repeat protein